MRLPKIEQEKEAQVKCRGIEATAIGPGDMMKAVQAQDRDILYVTQRVCKMRDDTI